MSLYTLAFISLIHKVTNLTPKEQNEVLNSIGAPIMDGPLNKAN